MEPTVSASVQPLPQPPDMPASPFRVVIEIHITAAAAPPTILPTPEAPASPTAAPPGESNANAGDAPRWPHTLPAQTSAAPQAPIARSTSQVTPPDTLSPPPAVTLWSKWKRWLLAVALILAIAVMGLAAWLLLRINGPGEGFISGNGRIEATEVDVAAKLGGRVQDILVDEGDFVTANQPLAHMQVLTLEAQRDEARARQQQSVSGVATAEAQVAMRESDWRAVQALVAQRESELDAAQRRLDRSETLTREGASSGQELDDDRARARSVQAGVVAARAQVAAAQAAIAAARTQVAGARSNVTAADASISRIKTDIDDSALVAPRDGRVQYRVAQPGEVLGAGGKVLNLVDLSEVHMTFFLPEAVAGKLALGSEARIVLDAVPQYTIPARVSFVSSTAQFTPKTVETASERQKLMFRVKAQIDRELLKKHLPHVKTGLPGVAWVKLDAQAQWPAELAVKVPP